jgi:hypothetical protein
MGERSSARLNGELIPVSSKAVAEADPATGVIPAARWRIKALAVLPNYRIAVTFQDGTQGVADLSAVTTCRECGIYSALKDPAYFQQVRMELGAVTWPNGADLDPLWMYEEISQRSEWIVPL